MQPQVDQRLQVGAFFCGAVDGLSHALRVPHIGVVKRDVVVTHQHQARVLGQLGLHPTAQRLQPTHFVGKLVAPRRLPIREIRANDAHRFTVWASVGARDHARVLINKAGDVFDHVGCGGACDQRHTVVGLLAEPLCLVARFSQRGRRKLVIGHFQLLQGQHVNRGACGCLRRQPVEYLWQAHGQRVDVPGNEFHVKMPSGAFIC